MRIAAGIRGTKRAQRLSVIAAIGIGALAFTGCTAINQQSTTLVYSASDGVRLNMGDLQLRNVMVISEAAGDPGRVAGTFYNQSSSDITLTIKGDMGSQTEITVKPGAPTVLNHKNDPYILSTVKVAPGNNESLELSTGSESTTLVVPVLDGTLKEYKNLVPTAAPSSEAAHESPSASPSVAP